MAFEGVCVNVPSFFYPEFVFVRINGTLSPSVFDML
jgi:hypothetical protein